MSLKNSNRLRIFHEIVGWTMGGAFFFLTFLLTIEFLESKLRRPILELGTASVGTVLCHVWLFSFLLSLVLWGIRRPRRLDLALWLVIFNFLGVLLVLAWIFISIARY